MKYLILSTMLLSFNLFAQEVPDYLRDGEIIVKLKNGKTYSFSANEYAVVKRGVKSKTVVADNYTISKADKEAILAAPLESDRKRNIVSGEVLRSQKGLKVNNSSNRVDAENKYEFGVGLMYQYNAVDDIYVGGRIDSNGGTGLNLGLGF